ncbi:hypothetical protein RvY_11114 [Ramazzottius varieornatus]|uniref:Uncharacterized protein n=1 Tax=Ramazzottius varieornatus TaxID=947166 RepID=A0A1D1VF38_RAMVA|nr:hypothetical protein RvY_11114 [Ramazzottius varieornatus]
MSLLTADFFMILALFLHVAAGGPAMQVQRGKRQVLLNNQLPSVTNQETAAQCEALSGQPAPLGCSYLPLVNDASGNPQNCRLDCAAGVAPLSLQAVSNELGPLTFPQLGDGFFSSLNQINTVAIDFSNINTYSGNSFAVLPTTPSPFLTTASNLVRGKFRRLSSLSSSSLIEACINSGQVPDAGCSFNGNGSPAPFLTCSQSCTSAFCDPQAGPLIERCLCARGAPPLGCSYTFGGTLDPLTCSQVCRPSFPTSQTLPSDALIEACIAAGASPGPGCSFSGYGTFGPPPTCGQICPPPPFPIGAPCSPTAGSHIEQCLCRGPPNRGCSYKLAGSSNPLSCLQMCVAVSPITPSTTTLRPTVNTSCIAQQGPPPAGCSYASSSPISPAMTCAIVCGPPPFLSCDPYVGSHIERCLCANRANGGPAPGCTYMTTGSSNPLTCPQECFTPSFPDITSTSTISPSTTISADTAIQQCLDVKGPPSRGCSYSGTVTSSGILTCAQVCAPAPFPISPPCDPTVGSNVERCLCANGSPPSGCSYLASGSFNPLACLLVCIPPSPAAGVTTTSSTTTPTVCSADAQIESCIAAGISPAAGCSFSGTASQGICGEVCPQDPLVSSPCDPNAASPIERCLCIQGSPPPACTYKTCGSGPNSCAMLCVAPTPSPG